MLVRLEDHAVAGVRSLSGVEYCRFLKLFAPLLVAALLFAILYVRGWLLAKVAYVTLEWPCFCQIFSWLLFAELRPR